MNWGKIAVGVRCGSGADPLFFISWTKLISSGLRAGDKILAPAIELPQHFAAQAVVENFLLTDADTLLMVDDDMVFSPKNLNDMREDPESVGYDIVQGLCLSRNPPHAPVILEEVPGCALHRTNTVPRKDCIVDVGVCGLAFTLIRRRVFDAVKELDESSRFLFNWGANGDSEDAGFSKLAKKAGAKLGVNTKVCIGHRLPVVLTWDHDKQGIAYETQLSSIKQKNILKVE